MLHVKFTKQPDLYINADKGFTENL